METESKILTREEIYPILVRALKDKKPLPPAGWCASQLDEEMWRATREYEPDALLRQRDALKTCLNYLVDFAVRMPERVNLTESNRRVKEICEDLALEVENIALRPDEVIERHGKLKVWLKAILSVQTCLIYCEETDRHNAEQDATKRAARLSPSKNDSLLDAPPKPEKWQSDLAKNIFQKVVGKPYEKPPEQSSEQPSLF